MEEINFKIEIFYYFEELKPSDLGLNLFEIK
jgi:hypothetical protein